MAAHPDLARAFELGDVGTRNEKWTILQPEKNQAPLDDCVRFVVRENQVTSPRWLVESRPDVDTCGEWELSSLREAVSHEARECVDCLMSPGDKMNVMQQAIERFGPSRRIRCYSLEKSCSPGRPDIAKRLVESEAHLADAGPMKCAAEKEHPKVAAQPAWARQLLHLLTRRRLTIAFTN